MPADIDLDQLATGIRAGERAWIARGITLVESKRPEHRILASDLLHRLTNAQSALSSRIGVTGIPGAGKSTFIEAFGTFLIEKGNRVGVLAVDPSSRKTGGSILGDKTRMPRLAASPNAFIRPSPSGDHLGGVARATRESMTILEAAGYNVIIVETVGVGQSEYAVADMVDTFLLLMVARTGDNLQGIKRGILELADIIAVNKADGDNVRAAQRSARELAAAIRLLQGAQHTWQTPVVSCSALEATGIEDLWEHVTAQRNLLTATGELDHRRREQRIMWMRRLIEQTLLDDFYNTPEIHQVLHTLEDQVRAAQTDPYTATQIALTRYRTLKSAD